MFLRNHWLPLSVFLIAFVGVGLYVLQTRPPKDPIISYKTTEVEKSPVAREPAQETQPRGHVHADGTFHAAPAVEMSDPESTSTEPKTVSCVGGCGQTGAEMFIWNSWRNYGRPMSRSELSRFGVSPEDSDQDITLVTLVSHRYHCEEQSRDSFLSIPTTVNCPGVYYNCNGQTCPNAENHIK